MTNNLKIALAFIFGGTVGSAVTYLAVRNKFEKQAHDEIEEIRTYYKGIVFGKATAKTEKPKNSAEEKPKTEPKIEAGIANKNLYQTALDEMPVYISEEKRPFVISPEEFGEIYEYRQSSLTYYASDGVLTNDGDEPIEDVDGTVGADFMTHFGEYEDDSVFVRNPELRCDYEILMDERSYADVAKRKPPDF